MADSLYAGPDYWLFYACLHWTGVSLLWLDFLQSVSPQRDLTDWLTSPASSNYHADHRSSQTTTQPPVLHPSWRSDGPAISLTGGLGGVWGRGRDCERHQIRVRTIWDVVVMAARRHHAAPLSALCDDGQLTDWHITAPLTSNYKDNVTPREREGDSLRLYDPSLCSQRSVSQWWASQPYKCRCPTHVERKELLY